MPIVSVQEFINSTFDYIVVGGGSTGLVIAARLSEDPNVVVGVIEAGESHFGAPEIDIPGFAGRAYDNPKFDWAFPCVPQEYIGGRVISQPRGKGLGGSSAINLMNISRPSKADLDALEALGNEGWNWDNLLKYFKRSERCIPPVDKASATERGVDLDPRFHGIDGPIIKSFSPWLSPLHPAMSSAFHELGVPTNVDPASGVNVGLNTAFGTIDPTTATRSYAASGYYAPNANRPNLLVVMNALVSRIALQPTTDGLQCAAGVDFIHAGSTFGVYGVRKEVILAAGSLQTPVLLELSGIGNPAILEKHGIQPVIGLGGVGENLQEHPLTYVICEVSGEKDSLDIMRDPAIFAKQQELYKAQQGILATMRTQQFAFVPASKLEDSRTIKQWQERVFDTSGEGEYLAGTGIQYDTARTWIADPNEACIEFMGLPGHYPVPDLPPVPGKRYYSIMLSLMHPFSRGSVHLSSRDPLAPPVIDPCYLSHPLDLALLASGVRFAKRVFDTDAMRADKIEFVVPKSDADDDIEDHVRRTLKCSFHPLGTASMRPRISRGVVDPELKVYGTTNLRIVDCSVIPMEVSSHIQSLAYAIAERAADIIKQTA